AAVPGEGQRPLGPLFDFQRQTERLRRSIDRRLGAVLDHGQFILGPAVAELDARLSAFVGDVEVVTDKCGRDALVIALLADQVGSGDAVFVPAFTFPATAEVVAACGAAPVFVDVEADTFNIDADRLEEAIGATER